MKFTRCIPKAIGTYIILGCIHPIQVIAEKSMLSIGYWVGYAVIIFALTFAIFLIKQK